MPPLEPLPPRSQPLIALILACLLVAAAVWFTTVGGLSGRLVDHDAAPPVAHAFTIDVNTADEAELAQLPGLGRVTARRIIDRRRNGGPFRSLDDLLDVPGVGPATLAAMRPHLRTIAPTAPTDAPAQASAPVPP